MARKSPNLILEEYPGERFPDLEAAQQAALRSLAAEVAGTIRELLAAGVLVQEGGRIIRDQERKQDVEIYSTPEHSSRGE